MISDPERFLAEVTDRAKEICQIIRTKIVEL